MKFYDDYIINKTKAKEIENILFEMGLTTDLILEGINDKYNEGLEKLKKIGEEKLAKAIEKKQVFFNI